MELELWQVETKYEGLRLVEKRQLARLTASLSQHGQKSPALVVEVDERYVLIDGYRRLEALRKLGRDTLDVTVLPLSEPEALVFSATVHRFGSRNVLEEAWLLQELYQKHRMSQPEIAVRFERSVSWVSRRLALVGQLPDAVEAILRRGLVSPHGAMRFLVPLARAKPEHVKKLAETLDDTRLSNRQLAKLYGAWCRGNAAQREELVSQPLLYLRALEEQGREISEADGSAGPQSPREVLLRDLENLARLCWRTRHLFDEESFRGGRQTLLSSILETWQAARSAFWALHSTLEARREHAGP